jgi:hypothetical protein
MITTPLPDTEHSLFMNAINVLKIVGQERIAEDMEQRMENLIKTPKIAIYIKGGMVEAVRSNISSELDIEIVDEDCIDEVKYTEDRWEEIQTELEFGNY